MVDGTNVCQTKHEKAEFRPCLSFRDPIIKLKCVLWEEGTGADRCCLEDFTGMRRRREIGWLQQHVTGPESPTRD